jgi:uncharacterized protein
MSYAASIKATEFARLEKELAGTCAPASLGRLAPLLGAEDGCVEYSLKGFVRRDDKPAVRLIVHARVTLQCQRCLEALAVEVESRRDLVFVPSGRLTAFEDEEEDADYLPLEDAIDPLGVVEDEVLLALPIAPRHAEGRCAASTSEVVPAPDDLH